MVAERGWLSSAGTDMERPILSASGWYLASLRRKVLSGLLGAGCCCSFGLLLYLGLGCRMARGVAENATGAPPDDPDSELLLFSDKSLLGEDLCLACGRCWPKGVMGYERPARGLRE